jgi:dTDP-4-dehydrorhamnose reductase
LSTRIAIIGASGFVGRYLLAHLGARGLGTYAGRLAPGLVRFDLTRDPVAQLGGGLSHLILAGAIGDPEKCARDPVGTRKVNVEGTKRVLGEAMAAGIAPVFVSTDYVFEGSVGGYREEDATAPTTEYGRQKKDVEDWLIGSGKPHLIVRLSKVVSHETDVASVLGPWTADIKAGRVIKAARDQVFSPACAGDIARAIAELCDRGASGIWHIAGPRPLSRFELAQVLVEEVAKIAGAEARVEAMSLREVPFLEARPLKTWVRTEKLQTFLPWKFRDMRDVCAEVARRQFG